VKNVVNFILRFRIPEIIFWAILYWSIAHNLSLSNNPSSRFPFTIAALIVAVQLACVYATMYVILPRFYFRQKYVALSLVLLLLFVTGAILTDLFSDLVKFFATRSESIELNWLSVISHFVDIVVLTMVLSGLHLGRHYYLKDRKNKEIEKQRLIDELHFLKSQINPHFLFNVLNSINILIDEEKEKAGTVLLKLSNLLRYQLYKNPDSKVYVSEEIDFIKDYIEIEKVRDYDRLKVKCNISEPIPELMIAPLILVTFVENAFKHISHFDDKENKIEISVNFKNKSQMNFYVANTFSRESDLKREGGIGLQNVKRRLELLYPNRHRLEIHQKEDFYVVNLEIELDEIQLPYSR